MKKFIYRDISESGEFYRDISERWQEITIDKRDVNDIILVII